MQACKRGVQETARGQFTAVKQEPGSTGLSSTEVPMAAPAAQWASGRAVKTTLARCSAVRQRVQHRSARWGRRRGQGGTADRHAESGEQKAGDRQRRNYGT